MYLKFDPDLEGQEIDVVEILKARSCGRLIHRESKEIWYPEETIYEDRFFAATPEWVAGYHRDGGLWSYDF
jgi:hypothetical protein